MVLVENSHMKVEWLHPRL